MLTVLLRSTFSAASGENGGQSEGNDHRSSLSINPTIELAIESGADRSQAEVIDQAFDILREQLNQEDWMRGQRDLIAAQIATGFAEAEKWPVR